jgi:hypothetical protein
MLPQHCNGVKRQNYNDLKTLVGFVFDSRIEQQYFIP